MNSSAGIFGCAGLSCWVLAVFVTTGLRGETFDLWVYGMLRGTHPPGQEGSTLLTAADAIATPSLGYVDMSFGMGKGRRPAAGMSQLAAKLYCKWLSAQTGRYYRLPTEAEWEHACRAGTTTAYSFGEEASRLEEFAWFVDNSDLQPQRVGQKKPNPWGLHDLHGNVAEWVLDGLRPEGYDAGLSSLSAPVVSPVDVDPRVVRGGSFDDESPRLRSAARRGSDARWRMTDPNLPKSIWWLRDAPFVGFRIVRPQRLPSPEEEASYYDLDALQQQQLAEQQGWMRLLRPPE